MGREEELEPFPVNSCSCFYKEIIRSKSTGSCKICRFELFGSTVLFLALSLFFEVFLSTPISPE